MPELIYKQEALDKLKYMYLLIERDRGQGNEIARGLRRAHKAISEIKAFDTESVRHGRWIQRRNGEYYCTNCGREEKFIFQKNYCPRGGADMREGGADNG